MTLAADVLEALQAAERAEARAFRLGVLVDLDPRNLSGKRPNSRKLEAAITAAAELYDHFAAVSMRWHRYAAGGAS